MISIRGSVRTRSILWLVCAAAAVPAPCGAQSAENVAVVINEASAASHQVGEHYVRARAIPETNVIRIKTTTDESVTRAAYVSEVETPIANAIRRHNLHDRILYIVLTKGVPLRIAGTLGQDGTAASVDSELTLLYRRMTGVSVPTVGYVANPYFLGARDPAEAKRFTHREHDIYLVTRLDAFTADEAVALIDRAQQTSAEGRIVLDQRVSASGPRSGDEWMDRAAERLSQQGRGDRQLLERTPQRAVTTEPVLGFYSWGAADPEYHRRRLGLAFVNGAIAASVASFDARTFREPPPDWQPSRSADKTAWFEGSSETLIADLVRDGVTGVAGQAGEAYVLGAVRPDVLFPAYFAGFNLAEAFYLATPALSWQQVVVGDPLATVAQRQRLTRRDVEDDADGATLLPGAFARRRIAAAKDTREQDDVVLALVKAETLVNRGDEAAAREALAEALEERPAATALLLSLAGLEEKAALPDAAIARYKRVLDLEPSNTIALNNLAYVLAETKGQAADALPFARKAASLAPRAANVIDTLGWVEHLVGNHDVASDLFKKAVSLDPSNAEIRVHAAIANAAAGRTEQAAKELEQALRLDPGLRGREDVQRLQRKQPGS